MATAPSLSTPREWGAESEELLPLHQWFIRHARSVGRRDILGVAVGIYPFQPLGRSEPSSCHRPLDAYPRPTSTSLSTLAVSTTNRFWSTRLLR